MLPGTGSCALTDTVYLSRAALEAGTADVLVLPPFYYKGVGDDGLFRFFAEVVERIGDDGLRLYLYHIPQMTSVELGLPLISRLSSMPILARSRAPKTAPATRNASRPSAGSS